LATLISLPARTAPKRLLLCGLLLFGAIAFLLGAEKKPQFNLILVGWDAVGRDDIKDALAKNQLPHLRRLIEKGSLVSIDVLHFSDTTAGWAEIFTGYGYEITGAFNNSEYREIPKGYTLFERLQERFGRENIATGIMAILPTDWTFTDDDPTDERPPLWNPANPDSIINKGLISFSARSADEFDSSHFRTNPKTMAFLEKYRNMPFFLFVHTKMVDHFGHVNGEGSPEHRDALVRIDKHLGKIMAKLKELHLEKKTLIYVTSDHGFDKKRQNHISAPRVFLASNDPKIIRGGEQADIAPTILDRYGFDLSKIEPPLDGRSLLRRYKKPKW